MSFQIDFPAQPRFPILAPAGTAAAPSYSFSGDTNCGFYYVGSDVVGLAANGAVGLHFGQGVLDIPYDNGLLRFGVGVDTVLVRDGAANTLALRNSTAAQTFRVYNTYTDASNYERATLSWESNTLFIGTQLAGTGSIRDIIIRRGSTSYMGFGITSALWNISSSGHLVASPDNTYDIGAYGATRPRTIYAGTGISTPLASLSVIALGGAGQAARVNLPAATTTVTHMNFTAGVAPTSPNDGDFWFDGTNFKARVGGVTKTFTIL